MANNFTTLQTPLRVKAGGTVSVVFDDGRELTVTVRDPREVNLDNGIVSYESPLGRSVLGKGEGDSFEYKVRGQKFSGRIAKIYRTD